ncbi:DUF4064 domain-containing protein [Sporolactobacillus pectinivorans]|uniref:DUF4064 domain-containing protein n=1 Tax=Sporolactobacillus pectinivorans TaxID=1591408 RepID=UPI000C268048|nr:DUF4064 domain-containing protein [Sporolactobacillus pectinivorans]
METEVNSTAPKATSRVAEMVLGIIGGVLGIIASIFVMAIGYLGDSLKAGGTGSFYGQGTACIIASVLAIIFSCIINKNRILFGILILVCGVLNMIFVGGFGILSGLLIIVSGVLALVRK